MGTPRDRILLVEHDPIISDLLGRQALQSNGYQVHIVGDASTALSIAEKFQPDLIIVDLNLPGLSGKDLLIALRTQGLDIPVVVISVRGLENEAIQAFRLGASDAISWPCRETEAAATVERVFKQVRETRGRLQATQQLQHANQELQNRVRELTGIFSASKAILSLDDPRGLNDRILDWAIRVAGADLGWLLLRDDPAGKFTLTAGRNLPAEYQLGQTWEDDTSTLAGLTGEPVSIFGAPLKRFKASSLGQSVAVIPIKIQKQTIGVLGLARKEARMFTESDQNMARAVAEYTAQALINMRLLRAYEEKAHSLQRITETAQAGEKVKAEILLNMSQELRSLNEAASSCIKQALEATPSSQPAAVRQALTSAQEKISRAVRVIDLVSPLARPNLARHAPSANAGEVASQVVPRLQRQAQQQGVTLLSELPVEPLLVLVDPAQLYQIIEGLVANAVSVTLPGGKVVLRLEKSPDRQARITVIDGGPGIEARDLPYVFDRGDSKEDPSSYKQPAGGISLPLIKELVSAYGGSIWVESKLGQGSSFLFTLPAVR